MQSNFDIVAASGSGNRAIDRSYTVTVTDGTINLQFLAVTENPKVSAIEIVPVSPGPGTVSTPTFSVTGGSYTSAQTIAIGTATSGATIRYTTDGSTPTSSNGTVYSSAVTISSTTTLKAVAYMSGWTNSSVASATYTISSAPPTGTTIRVNAGGANYTDGSGHLWSADSGFVSGNAYSTGASIANTTDGPLYQTERWNSSKLEYQFAVANGSYTVNLKFAELYFTSAGQRVFNIVINGQAMESNFDIVAAAGGGAKAIDKSYPVTVTDGSINIQLVAVTENPKVNAIEILPLSSGPGTVAAPVFSVPGGTYTTTQTVTISTSTSGATIRYTTDGSTPTASNGTVYSNPVAIGTNTTLKAIAYKGGWADSPVTSATYTFSSGPEGTTIRVNAGGSAYTDGAGRVWNSDSGYVAGNAYSTSASIQNTQDGALYQTERWNPTKLEYRFTVANGTYRVNLKFAELYFANSGQRVFNIIINGQIVQNGFDIVAAAGGGNRAIDKSYSVIVTNGTLNIELTALTENPKINAIEILPSS